MPFQWLWSAEGCHFSGCGAVNRRMFPGTVISRFGARFKHLWGYLKSRVYAHNPLTLADLKETIKQEEAAIDCEMLDRAYTAFQQRLESCIQENGHHLSDVIFH
jgi:hypothetical protein